MGELRSERPALFQIRSHRLALGRDLRLSLVDIDLAGGEPTLVLVHRALTRLDLTGAPFELPLAGHRRTLTHADDAIALVEIPELAALVRELRIERDELAHQNVAPFALLIRRRLLTRGLVA